MAGSVGCHASRETAGGSFGWKIIYYGIIMWLLIRHLIHKSDTKGEIIYE